MTDVQSLLHRRAAELTKQDVPFIAYCHVADNQRGLSIIQLGRKKIGKVVENTLATSFLRSLNKQIMDLIRSYSTVCVVVNLAPLSQEDLVKIARCCPAVEYAENGCY